MTSMDVATVSSCPSILQKTCPRVVWPEMPVVQTGPFSPLISSKCFQSTRRQWLTWFLNHLLFKTNKQTQNYIEYFRQILSTDSSCRKINANNSMWIAILKKPECPLFSNYTPILVFISEPAFLYRQLKCQV